MSETSKKVQAETVGATLGDVEAYALVTKLTEMPAKVQADKVGYTLADLEDYSLVATSLTDTLAKVEAETLSDVEGRHKSTPWLKP